MMIGALRVPGGFLVTILIGLAVPAAAIAPPIPQVRTDCSKPQYASDHLVCSDAELRRLDAELAAAPALPQISSAAIWEDDEAWFRRSRQCAFAGNHRACLKAAYDERLAMRRAASREMVVPMQCEGGWAGRTVQASAPGGSHVAFSDAEGFLGVAAARRSAGWEPILRYRLRGSSVYLSGNGGRNFRCRIGAGDVKTQR